MNYLTDTIRKLMVIPKINPLENIDISMSDVKEALKPMILSASGWRKVFAVSNSESDVTAEIGDANAILTALMADTFADYILLKNNIKTNKVVIGIDARPTGQAMANIMIPIFISKGIDVVYTFITAAPEIMAFSKNFAGFVYISASHNPIGHNGVKFGLNDGGVLPGSEIAPLVESFKSRCIDKTYIKQVLKKAVAVQKDFIEAVYSNVIPYKTESLEAYEAFTKEVIADTQNKEEQEMLFEMIRQSVKKDAVSVIADMNGSARTLSIDRKLFELFDIKYNAINSEPGKIVHAIIPEPENLIYCAAEMKNIHDEFSSLKTLLGYMPDCDGDRGNIVFWNEKTGCSEILKAQEVFALSVLAELTFMHWQNKTEKLAVAVNDPTSMRIEEIASKLGAAVFRAEVGEANVVNLAREKRNEGYTIRILGEGSNGGNITHPAAVRDPVNTIFALLKLLVIRDTPSKKGLFHIWCDKAFIPYNDDFTLAEILESLPKYTTTGVSEKRAVTKIVTTDHAVLKRNYQKVFEASLSNIAKRLFEKYDIHSWKAVCNNGTTQTDNLEDFGVSGKGGLKIIFNDKNENPVAFIWMRGSGTEPVFRVMCDVKGDNCVMEKELLEYHTALIQEADSNL